MRRRSSERYEMSPVEDDFTRKANELDFDPWGTEEEDGAARRHDPLRRPVGRRLDEDEDAD